MSDIEASVTKLLIATKQLLESLTQWSRLEASENDVSDIYVNLGNEFNRATISFQNAGIDMSDLENTPNELRHILERALGEDASVTNLDKFLPRIREIIINLLQGLKRKQQIHRIQNGEAAAPPRLRRLESPAPVHSATPISNDLARQRSASPSIASAVPVPTAQNVNGHLAANVSPAKRQLPSIPVHQTSPSQILPPRKAPEPPGVNRELFNPAPAIPSTSDPVTQLSQMTLERRSSKRFSENYLAQLTSSPTSDRSAKLSVNDVRKHLQKTIAIPEAIEDEGVEAVEYSASHAYGGPKGHIPKPTHVATVATSPSLPYRVIEAPSPRSPETKHASKFSEEQSKSTPVTNGAVQLDHDEPLLVFLRHDDQVKKLTLEHKLKMEDLHSSVSTSFDFNDKHVLYIEDPVSKVAYELEKIEDVKQRSVIIIRPKSLPQAQLAATQLHGDTDALKTWLDQKLAQLKLEIAEMQPSIVQRTTTNDQVATKMQDNLTTTPELSKVANVVATEDASQDLAAMKLELGEVRAQLTEAQAALELSATSEPVPIVVSANRDHVMSMSAKHEHRGTELTAKLEEAMNTMERIRKDVLQRKVTPRPQQLADLSREFDEISKESTALADNLVLLDAASNKLWEEELTIITAEQEALEYQRAFIDDIKADLDQSLSSLSTIKQVEEQKRVGTVTSVPMVLETSTDPSRAIKFVQADIKSLQINHEKRAEAIADAERQRVKEREYLLENEFKKELGAFVGSNNLKDTGGAAEIERLRAEKDEAHRKASFNKSRASEDKADKADKAAEVTQTYEAAAEKEVETVQENRQDDSEHVVPVDSAASKADAPNDSTKISTSENAEKPRAVSGSASILARIDASSRGFDALERRRSSLMKHVPSNESLSKQKQEQGEVETIVEDDQAEDKQGTSEQ